MSDNENGESSLPSTSSASNDGATSSASNDGATSSASNDGVITNSFIDANLNLLEGLRAYSQETLEHEVSRQLEKEISARDQERELGILNKELSQVEADLSKHEEGLKQVRDKLFKALMPALMRVRP